MRFLLLPFSWIYGLIVYLRNRIYDGRGGEVDTSLVPLIVIGNLAVGGTGKTPHVEYLIDLLKAKRRVAVLSRGYGRKTKGFILLGDQATPHLVGDEPFQMWSKNKDVPFAVCENRVLGVRRLMELPNSPEVILLDDAFQHRTIVAGMNILLSEYDRPYFKDYMLPVGRLRDNKREAERAQIIVFTKSPEAVSLSEQEKISEEVNFSKPVLFSTYSYSDMLNYNSESIPTDAKDIIVVTGIANPTPFITHLSTKYNVLDHIGFKDHHDFCETDVMKILEKKATFVKDNVKIVTTEKDYVKLKKLIGDSFDFHYIPIQVEFLEENKKEFDLLINNYLEKKI